MPLWLVATYQSTTLFSLRPALSTSSGGQTLVVPTPYALKMALLDAAIRGWGLEQGKGWFPALRDLQVAVAGPARLVVNNTFLKIQRLKKGGPSDKQGTGIVGPMDPTIAFRAFVQFGGPLRIAIALAESQPVETQSKGRRFKGSDAQPSTGEPPPLRELLAQVNYLGKRGGFMQLMAAPDSAEELPEYPHGEFVRLNGPKGETFPIDGLMQVVDDCAAHLSFAQVDVDDGQSLKVDRDRVFHHRVLPYHQIHSSYRYQIYERIPSGRGS